MRSFSTSLTRGRRKTPRKVDPANSNADHAPRLQANQKQQLAKETRIRHSGGKRKKRILEVDDCQTLNSPEGVRQMMDKMRAKYTNGLAAQANRETDSKVENRCITILNLVSDFMGAYSGVCEVARTAAGGKAEVPYVALSVLLVVAMNMSKIGDIIKETLTDIKEEFPDVADIAVVINDPDLYYILERLAENINSFSESAIYFNRTTWLARVWYALLHPPSRNLDPARAEINKDIWKIQKKVLGFMAKRITELERGMEQEREENARYREHKKAEEEKRALNEVRHLLGIESQETENAALKFYEDLIDRHAKPKYDLMKILKGVWISSTFGAREDGM
ncbi:hypothetical protein DL95DRAFT_455143 [Leptodontidium sp. 2 PMI_412]|nr:hypothetical protein DL95DRAFT_455143 [Leptodontidium sp. 2 PMI_412]